MSQVATAPRAMTALLRDRRFGPYIAARWCAAMGVWIFTPIAAIEMFRLTGSGLWVGLVGVVQFAPQVVLAPILGAMADRGSARRQVLLGYLTSGTGALLAAPVIGGADLAGFLGFSDELWLLIASAVIGFGFSIGGSAGLAMVAELVPSRDLPAASQLNSVPLLISRAVGPALGALLLVGPGAGFCFIVAGCGNLVALVVMFLLGLPRRLSGESTRADQGMGATVRHVLAHRRLALTLIGIAVVGAASDPATTLTPLLADRLDAPREAAGWMTAAFGVGSLAAVPWVSWLRRGVGLFGGLGVGLGMMAAGLAVTMVPSLGAAIGGMFVAGVGMTLGYTTCSILVQLLSPPEMRARVLALWIVAFLGLRPVAALMTGGGVEWLGVVPVVSLMVAGVVVVAVWCWRSRDSDGSEAEPLAADRAEPVLEGDQGLPSDLPVARRPRPGTGGA